MIYVVGLGPGGRDQMTDRAAAALEKCEAVLGYKTYIELLRPFYKGKAELVSSPMRGETERCREALRRSLAGETVGLVSSGDPGVYGMAGIMLEIADGRTEVEIIPGMTAASTAAAVLGAPLMHDFAVISLSDLLTPWTTIEMRLEAASAADFIICLYNPASAGRPDNLRKAAEIIMKSRSAKTPSGWVRNAGRGDESHGVTTLAKIAEEPVDMLCTVVIGNSSTKLIAGRMVTPRGYEVAG